MIIGYIRVSTNSQDVDGQRLAILEYARLEQMQVTEIIEVEASSRRNHRTRRLNDLTAKVTAGDTIIVAALDRLGRSTGEVVNLVNDIISAGIALHVVKQQLRLGGGELDIPGKIMVTVLALLADLERDMISSRTKAGLHARKAAGVVLGKPRGTIQASGLDRHRPDIERLIAARVSVAAIARLVGSSRSNLTRYIKTRSIN